MLNSYGKNLENLTYLIQGSPNACKSLVVIGEPNCPSCNDLYNETLQYIMAGELKIFWTFVSFIDITSRGKIFSIWDGNVPKDSNFPKTALGAFVYNGTFFTDESGAIQPSNHPSKCAIQIANQSEDFFIEYIPVGTPIILYIEKKINLHI